MTHVLCFLQGTFLKGRFSSLERKVVTDDKFTARVKALKGVREKSQESLL